MLNAKQNASLRKSRAPIGDWRKLAGKKGSSKKSNPYADFQMGGSSNNNNINIPHVPTQDKQKIKRRLSMKVDAPLGPDFSSIPALPTSALAMIEQQQQQSSEPSSHANQMNMPMMPAQKQQRPKQGSVSSAGPYGHKDHNGSNSALGGGSYSDLSQTFTRVQTAGTEDAVRPGTAKSKGISFSEAFSTPGFDAQKFVMSNLQSATAAEIEEFSLKLVDFDEKVQEDIKNNVNKSYEKILTISNDLTATESELKHLKTTLVTLQDITNQMKEVAEARLQRENGDGSSVSSNNNSNSNLNSLEVPGMKSRRARDRSSVILLEKRWVDELNNLFKHVEGASQMLTASPSRHVLAESGKWFELNAATWKQLNISHLFILNDHVMIAVNKRRRNNGGGGSRRTNLVAEHCWPLREVKLTEIENVTHEKYYTLNFKYHGSSYIYQTERKEEFIKVKAAFRKAQNDLRDISEQESLKQRNLRESMSILSASDKSGKRNSNLLQDLSASMHTRSTSLYNSGVMRGIKDVDDIIDEIDIQIGHHKFGEAVELIKVCDEQIEKRRIEAKNGGDSTDDALVLIDVLKMKLNQRQHQLENALVFEIHDELQSGEDINEYIFFLRTLDSTAMAKENLLLSRSKLVGTLIDKLEFEGDLPEFISQTSMVRFQTIKSTTLLYQQAFPEPEYMSDIVKWGTEEVQKHAEMLKKQLFDVKVDSPIYKKCIDITQRQVADLKSVGLDFEFLLEEVLGS